MTINDNKANDQWPLNDQLSKKQPHYLQSSWKPNNFQIPLIKVDVESIPMINGNTAYGVYRFTDPETRATCYIYTGYKAGGLSCDFKSW